MSWFQRLFKKSYDGGAVTTDSSLTTTSTLAVGGASTLTGAVAMGAAATVATTLGVTGASTLTGGATIKGSLVTSNGGSPEAAITGVRKGDLCTDYTNGALYVFGGTAGQNTGWKLVTQAG